MKFQILRSAHILGSPDGASPAWRRLGTACLAAIDAALFPAACAVCAADGQRGALCADCRAELLDAAGAACPRCAMPVGPWESAEGGCSDCRGRALGFDAALALGPYQGPLRALTLRLKRSRAAWLAPALADVLIEARRGELEAARPTAVVPVPLHWRRRLARGYNQAEALADQVARRLGLPLLRSLRRTVATQTLAGLGRAARRAALRRAFRCRTAPRPDLAAGPILLVDDILTTGATCGAAARALKAAGARRVVALVLARAEGSGATPTISRPPATGGPAGILGPSGEADEPTGGRPAGAGSPASVSGGPARPTRPHPAGSGRAVAMPPSADESRTLLRIGTRGSRLARWQAEWVAAELRRHHPGLDVVLVEIKTAGDRDRNSPLAAIGGMGLFTKEIQRALAEGAVDVAVHSLKDLPTRGLAGLVLGAIPPREEATDALIAPAAGSLEDLPVGAQVGTSSLRRRAQLLHLRPDLRVVNLRGNVETRLKQATAGTLDAVVLATAGLNRLGLAEQISERLGPPRFLPAVGQGALGIECRADDAATRARLAPLDDPATRRAVVAERQLLADLEGGCIIPLAAWARDRPEGLALDAVVFDPDGRRAARTAVVGPGADPEGLGHRAAAALRAAGADALLATFRD